MAKTIALTLAISAFADYTTKGGDVRTFALVPTAKVDGVVKALGADDTIKVWASKKHKPTLKGHTCVTITYLKQDRKGMFLVPDAIAEALAEAEQYELAFAPYGDQKAKALLKRNTRK